MSPATKKAGPTKILPKTARRPISPSTPEPAPKVKVIRDKAFGQRLESACDGNPHVPPPNKGRLGWFRAQLQERFGDTVSIETVRKWFAGEVKPRPDKVKQLAALLEVDESWLSLGVQPDLEPRERKVRNAIADGAVNVLAGFIQMAGGHPAFPEPDDKRAARNHIDLYAIIKGAQYAFHVALGRKDGGELKFTVPPTYEDVFVIGVEPTAGPGVKFFELPGDWITATGIRKGGALEVQCRDESELRRIKDFSARI